MHDHIIVHQQQLARLQHRTVTGPFQLATEMTVRTTVFGVGIVEWSVGRVVAQSRPRRAGGDGGDRGGAMSGEILAVGHVRQDRQHRFGEPSTSVGIQLRLPNRGHRRADAVRIPQASQQQQVGTLGMKRILGVRAQQDGAARAGLLVFVSGGRQDVVDQAPALLALPAERFARAARQQQHGDIQAKRCRAGGICGMAPVAGCGPQVAVVDR